MQIPQYVRRVTALPRVRAGQALAPRPRSTARLRARLSAIVAALGVALHALASGHALVARVRIEVVPAAAAPGPSGPAACVVAVVPG